MEKLTRGEIAKFTEEIKGEPAGAMTITAAILILAAAVVDLRDALVDERETLPPEKEPK